MGIANRDQIEAASEVVHAVFPGTPQYCWPLLAERTGVELWVKHENHTPIGAFKIRGGAVFMADHIAAHPTSTGVIAATRGNHGQGVAFGASRYGLSSTIVVPEGNSVEKNAAMRAFGAELVVHGHDFQEAYEYAQTRAKEDGLVFTPSFHELLVRGVATYAVEFFQNAPEMERVYVPIGLGSGICGVLSARDALGLKTKVYGVVAEGAQAYGLSYKAGEPVSTNAAITIADGMACRTPVAQAVEAINAGAEDVVTVTDAQIKHAMRIYFTHTHNVAEGSGAAPLAALLNDRAALQGKRAGVILTGGNIDIDVFRDVIAEPDPDAAPH
ncbi:MAG: threonine dehydratase [Alphaproteobacteria bacterium]|nr:threonine dehydratase [Alphaproteobacteria bacterium]